MKKQQWASVPAWNSRKGHFCLQIRFASFGQDWIEMLSLKLKVKFNRGGKKHKRDQLLTSIYFVVINWNWKKYLFYLTVKIIWEKKVFLLFENEKELSVQ